MRFSSSWGLQLLVFCSKTKTTAAKTMDRLRRLLGVDGHAGARRRSGVLLGRRRIGRERKGKTTRTGGMEQGGCETSPGREKRARGGMEGARRRRVAPGWLGGIPPSSLGARGGGEDPRAPGGPGGLAGPAPPGRQVSLSLLFLFNLSFLFLHICFGSDKNIKPFYKMLKLFMWHHIILG